MARRIGTGGGVRRFVYMSSAKIYPEATHTNGPLDSRVLHAGWLFPSTSRFVIIVDPSIDLPERSFGIRKWVRCGHSPGFDECLRHTAGLWAGEARRQVERLGEQPGLPCRIGRAVVGKMLDGCGARVAPKRFSTASSIMSRTSEQDVPTLTTAAQAMISRSKTSMMKASRTASPFQQVTSRPSEHQRRFERMT